MSDPSQYPNWGQQPDGQAPRGLGQQPGDPPPGQGAHRPRRGIKPLWLVVGGIVALMASCGAGISIGAGGDVPPAAQRELSDLRDHVAELEAERDSLEVELDDLSAERAELADATRDAEQSAADTEALRRVLEERDQTIADLERQLAAAEDSDTAAETGESDQAAAAPAPPPPPPTPAEDTVVETFNGSGQHATRPFTVGDGWEIQWTNDDLLQIYVYSEGGDLVAVAANEEGAGEGSSFQARGGSYYLEMNALGSWTVNVVQVGR